MATKMSDAIKQLIQERGISEDLVRKTIEESLLAAYKNKFGSMDNAVVRFSDDGSEVTVFSRKKIVEELEDPVREISLEDAIEYNEESEIGDELLIEVSPREFDRSAVQSAKQKTKQTLREIQRNTEGNVIKKIFSGKPPDEARFIALSIIRSGEYFVLFGTVLQDRVHLILASSESLDRDMRELMSVVSPLIDGKGGGSPTLVEIVGQKKENLEVALDKASDFLGV